MTERDIENYYYLAPNYNQFDSMKKLLFLPLICLMPLAGCKDKIVVETTWDYPNVNIIIHVKDEQGINLLDERAAKLDYILDQNMTIIHDGTTYPIKKITRAEEPLLPVMSGFYVLGHYAEAKLVFGEFSIDTKEYRGETFTIDWGDGTTSEVKFDIYATPNGKNEQPTFHYATWLDGKVNSENSLTVTVTAGEEGVGSTIAD